MKLLKPFNKKNLVQFYQLNRKFWQQWHAVMKLLYNLLETLLDVYRNDTEGLKLDLAPVDLSILAEDGSWYSD